MKVYNISQLWVDTLENHNAYGYDSIGFTTNDELVKELLKIQVPKSMFPYPLNYVQNKSDSVPRFVVTEMKHLSDITNIDLTKY